MYLLALQVPFLVSGLEHRARTLALVPLLGAFKSQLGGTGNFRV